MSPSRISFVDAVAVAANRVVDRSRNGTCRDAVADATNKLVDRSSNVELRNVVAVKDVAVVENSDILVHSDLEAVKKQMEFSSKSLQKAVEGEAESIVSGLRWWPERSQMMADTSNVLETKNNGSTNAVFLEHCF